MSGVASVPNPLFPLIVGPVMVLVRARPFAPIVGLDLFLGPTVWVTLFPTLVSECALNRLLPVHPGFFT